MMVVTLSTIVVMMLVMRVYNANDDGVDACGECYSNDDVDDDDDDDDDDDE